MRPRSKQRRTRRRASRHTSRLQALTPKQANKHHASHKGDTERTLTRHNHARSTPVLPSLPGDRHGQLQAPRTPLMGASVPSPSRSSAPRKKSPYLKPLVDPHAAKPHHSPPIHRTELSADFVPQPSDVPYSKPRASAVNQILERFLSDKHYSTVRRLLRLNPHLRGQNLKTILDYGLSFGKSGVLRPPRTRGNEPARRKGDPAQPLVGLQEQYDVLQQARNRYQDQLQEEDEAVQATSSSSHRGGQRERSLAPLGGPADAKGFMASLKLDTAADDEKEEADSSTRGAGADMSVTNALRTLQPVGTTVPSAVVDKLIGTDRTDDTTMFSMPTAPPRRGAQHSMLEMSDYLKEALDMGGGAGQDSAGAGATQLPLAPHPNVFTASYKIDVERRIPSLGLENKRTEEDDDGSDRKSGDDSPDNEKESERARFAASLIAVVDSTPLEHVQFEPVHFQPVPSQSSMFPVTAPFTDTVSDPQPPPAGADRAAVMLERSKLSEDHTNDRELSAEASELSKQRTATVLLDLDGVKRLSLWDRRMAAVKKNSDLALPVLPSALNSKDASPAPVVDPSPGGVSARERLPDNQQSAYPSGGSGAAQSSGNPVNNSPAKDEQDDSNPKGNALLTALASALQNPNALAQLLGNQQQQPPAGPAQPYPYPGGPSPYGAMPYPPYGDPYQQPYGPPQPMMYPSPRGFPPGQPGQQPWPPNQQQLQPQQQQQQQQPFSAREQPQWQQPQPGLSPRGYLTPRGAPSMPRQVSAASAQYSAAASLSPRGPPLSARSARSANPPPLDSARQRPVAPQVFLTPPQHGPTSSSPGAVEVTSHLKKDLFTKCKNDRHHAVEEMFAMGVPVDVADHHGNQAIHVACQNGSKKMLKVCLRWGANINAQNNQGQSPLHYVFAYHYDSLGAYLISKGADDKLQNHFGFTCYDGLRPDDRDEAIRLLRKRLGDQYTDDLAYFD